VKQYMNIKELAEQLGCSPQTIRNRISEMRKYPARYGEISFYGTGSKVAVRTACFFDYDHNKELLERYPELAPPFNPQAYESELGITQKYPTAREIALEVVALLKQKRGE